MKIHYGSRARHNSYAWNVDLSFTPMLTSLLPEKQQIYLCHVGNMPPCNVKVMTIFCYPETLSNCAWCWAVHKKHAAIPSLPSHPPPVFLWNLLSILIWNIFQDLKWKRSSLWCSQPARAYKIYQYRYYPTKAASTFLGKKLYSSISFVLMYPNREENFIP